MGDTDFRLQARRALLLLAPGAVAATFLQAQQQQLQQIPPVPEDKTPVRLPNGKLQSEEILKADYAKNVKDARGLIDLAKSFEEDLEKDDRYVLSVSSLKKLDEMDKTIRRIRDRLKKV